MDNTADMLCHRRLCLGSLEIEPDFSRTDLFACLRAPRCPPFLVLVLVLDVALKKVSALVLQRGAPIVVLVLPLFGVGGLDRGQGALQRM